MLTKFFLFLSVFVLAISPIHPLTNSPSHYLYAVENLNLTETKLAVIPEDYGDARNIVFSANGQKVSYVARKGEKEFVVIGNKAGKPYADISRPVRLSGDGRRAAYSGRRDKKEYLVLDGAEGRPYDSIHPVRFSPDGRFFVSEVTDGVKYFVTVNDKKSPHDDNCFMEPVFSPDSKLVFYVLSSHAKGEMTRFISDTLTMKTKRTKTYKRLGEPGFSPDGWRFAYAARKKEGYFLVLGDFALNKEREQPVGYEEISTFVFSPDGKRLSYNALRQGKVMKVFTTWDNPSQVDERAAYDFAKVGTAGAAVFSPDGQVVAYPLEREEVSRVVVNGREGKSYGQMLQPVFSPDGARIAYPAMKDGKWFIVVSPAGKPDAVKEGPAYDMVVTPIFSPDGSKIVYRARRGQGERFIVIANLETGKVIKEGHVSDEVWQPVFSADGKSVAYGARIGRELWWKVQTLP